MTDWSILHGDARALLPTLPAESVHCCVTSPPFYGLRDYGCEGQIGLEETPEEYVAELVAVFRDVRRVLRDDGTLWLNLGDSYNAYNGNRGTESQYAGRRKEMEARFPAGHGLMVKSLKPKDLIGIPWMTAFALRADGWTLRSEIIWAKPNPMPESVTDRPTKSHEQLFLFAKGPRYYYDADAIREPIAPTTLRKGGYDDDGMPAWKANRTITASSLGVSALTGNMADGRQITINPAGRNRRSVWTIPTESYEGAHFAVYPPDLIKPCILAGCPVSGTVLDPFAGSGTTGEVALTLGRSFLGIELNPKYCELIRKRCSGANPPLPLFTVKGE